MSWRSVTRILRENTEKSETKWNNHNFLSIRSYRAYSTSFGTFWSTPVLLIVWATSLWSFPPFFKNSFWKSRSKIAVRLLSAKRHGPALLSVSSRKRTFCSWGEKMLAFLSCETIVPVDFVAATVTTNAIMYFSALSLSMRKQCNHATLNIICSSIRYVQRNCYECVDTLLPESYQGSKYGIGCSPQRRKKRKEISKISFFRSN